MMGKLTRKQRRELKKLGIELTGVKASTPNTNHFKVAISCKVDGMPDFGGIDSSGPQGHWTHEELFQEGLKTIINMVRVQRIR